MPLLREYEASLIGKSQGTIDNYMRAVTKLTDWIATLPGSTGIFEPEMFTRTAMQTYIDQLEREGYSPSHRNIVKAAASSFAEWLIEDKELLGRNPTRRIQIEAKPMMAPRMLTFDQRYVLKNLVERANNPRGAALFALGYWAGCRVSDVSHLKMANVHLMPRSGWIRVGYKGNKMREIDLAKSVRDALSSYLEADLRMPDSQYVFTSQRSDQLSEAGIHHWFRSLKANAKKDEWELVEDVSYHDLRHDFAHRA
ncbi:MAG: tyrosine-type recombinase/integrase, partial [Anaerolineae bacterium]|nr:tyrosine-type recombinase/integrase [Anaerolineae bacterium]